MEPRLGGGCSTGAVLEGFRGMADKVAELGRDVGAIGGCDVLGLGLMGGGMVVGGKIRGAAVSVDQHVTL